MSSNPTIVYLCKRNLLATGITTSAEGPTEANILGANLLVSECQEMEKPIVPGEKRQVYGPCPEDCELQKLASMSLKPGRVEQE